MRNSVAKKRFVVLAVMLAVVLSACFMLSGCGLFDDSNRTYMVIFYTNCDENIPMQTVPAGGKIVRPDDPANGNLKLDGWYTDSAFTTEWNFETDVVTGMTVLYAK